MSPLLSPRFTTRSVALSSPCYKSDPQQQGRPAPPDTKSSSVSPRHPDLTGSRQNMCLEWYLAKERPRFLAGFLARIGAICMLGRGGAHSAGTVAPTRRPGRHVSCRISSVWHLRADYADALENMCQDSRLPMQIVRSRQEPARSV